MKKKLRIAHMTDIHPISIPEQGRAPDMNGVNLSIQKVNSLKPDIVVITGDVSENELELNEETYKIGKEIIDRIECPIKYVLAGNHDIAPEDPEGEYFKKYFGDTQFTHNADGAYIVGINSTYPERHIDEILAEMNKPDHFIHSAGYIKDKTLEFVKDKIKNHSDPNDVRILAMHHHLLPISGKVRGIIDNANMLYNSGDFLDLLFDNHFDIVIHGHRHVPRTFMVNNLLILSGRAMGYDYKGQMDNGFNIIDIDDNITVTEYYVQSDTSKVLHCYKNIRYNL